MAKVGAAVERLTLREMARIQIADAICGYMRRDGYHVCRRIYANDGIDGCMWRRDEENTITSWQGLMAVVEGALDDVEAAGRELGAMGL